MANLVKLSFAAGMTAEVLIDGASVVVNGEQLPETSVDYALLYGLKQTLADSYASEKDDEARKGAFLKKLDKLHAGTIFIRDSGPRGDIVMRTAYEIALPHVREAAKAKMHGEGKLVGDYVFEDNEPGEPSIRAAARANAPSFKAEAEARLETERQIQVAVKI